MTEMAIDAHDQEVMGSHEIAQIIKGKRTKRLRPGSPMAMATTSASSSAGGSSVEFAESTAGEEEEELANFLILLSKGHQADLSTATSNKGRQGLNVYQCRTCSRCFPSFQALGGHRTSHRRPKANVEEKKAGNTNTNIPLMQMAEGRSLCSSTVKSDNKFHECSICGAEFSSGQALGGHMRRHGAMAATNSSTETATTTKKNNEFG